MNLCNLRLAMPYKVSSAYLLIQSLLDNAPNYLVRCDIQKRYLHSTLHHNTDSWCHCTQSNQIGFARVLLATLPFVYYTLGLQRKFVVNCIEPIANHIWKLLGKLLEGLIRPILAYEMLKKALQILTK